VADAGKLLKREASVFNGVVTEQLRLWRSKETEALRVIEAKRKELEAQGVRLDMGFIAGGHRGRAHHGGIAGTHARLRARRRGPVDLRPAARVVSPEDGRRRTCSRD